MHAVAVLTPPFMKEACSQTTAAESVVIHRRIARRDDGGRQVRRREVGGPGRHHTERARTRRRRRRSPPRTTSAQGRRRGCRSPRPNRTGSSSNTVAAARGISQSRYRSVPCGSSARTAKYQSRYQSGRGWAWTVAGSGGRPNGFGPTSMRQAQHEHQHGAGERPRRATPHPARTARPAHRAYDDTWPDTSPAPPARRRPGAPRSRGGSRGRGGGR